jgi:hypothetical protein
MKSDVLTESEIEAIVDAMARGVLEAADSRSDGDVDADPMGDPNRVGQRLVDGFAMLGGTS